MALACAARLTAIGTLCNARGFGASLSRSWLFAQAMGARAPSSWGFGDAMRADDEPFLVGDGEEMSRAPTGAKKHDPGTEAVRAAGGGHADEPAVACLL